MIALDESAQLASAARTSTQTGPDQINSDRYDMIELYLDLTAFSTAASLTLRLQRWDPAKGAFVDLLVAAALTGNGQSTLRLGPLVPDVANLSRTGYVPGRFRWVVTHGNGNSHTYSLSQFLYRSEGRQA